MRTQKIPWRRVEQSAAKSWSGRLLGGLLLVLALAIIYHGTEGHTMMQQLSSYLGGGAANGSTQMVTPVAGSATSTSEGSEMMSLEHGLQGLTPLIKAGDWTSVTASMATMETTWNDLENRLGKAGVQALDLNAFTADMANLALDVSTNATNAALTDVQNAQKSLDWVNTVYVAASAPTLSQLQAIAKDLHGASAAHDWARVNQDANALNTLVTHITQGF